jgi:hypothetical protein
MKHRHKDMVILLELNVVIEGQTCVLHLLISLTCVLVSGFILVVYLFNQHRERPRSICINL